MHKIFNSKELASLDKRFRVNLINSLPGFKSANLIATINQDGKTNLAIFSSVIHMGSNPPLFGFITRPNSVPRHTYENIKATGDYTINQIQDAFFEKAHQTSARYPREISEFEAVGLSTSQSPALKSPYVAESTIKMGMKLVEEHIITANDTILVIGQVVELFLPQHIIADDGHLDLELAHTVCISGLDCYHRTDKISRLPYAKPG